MDLNYAVVPVRPAGMLSEKTLKNVCEEFISVWNPYSRRARLVSCRTKVVTLTGWSFVGHAIDGWLLGIVVVHEPSRGARGGRHEKRRHTFPGGHVGLGRR